MASGHDRHDAGDLVHHRLKDLPIRDHPQAVQKEEQWAVENHLQGILG